MLAEEHHQHRSRIPPYSVRAGKASREDSGDFDTSLVQTQEAEFEI